MRLYKKISQEINVLQIFVFEGLTFAGKIANVEKMINFGYCSTFSRT